MSDETPEKDVVAAGEAVEPVPGASAADASAPEEKGAETATADASQLSDDETVGDAAEDVEAPETVTVAEADEASAEAAHSQSVEEADADAPARPKAPRRRRGGAKATAEEKAPAEVAAPAPAPQRSASRPAARRAVVRAQAKYVRTSARKARMVCGHIRGKSVAEARAILAFTPRDVARDWSKLLESAVANAENNHELIGDELVVREAYADEGPTIKRFRPRAMGRATPIRKRTSHLTITLTPRS